MPKTQNAFAFRGLYNALYAACGFDYYVPTYRQRVNFCDDDVEAEQEYLNSPDAIIEETLLKYIDGGEIENVGRAFPKFKRLEKMLSLGKARILKTRKIAESIERHIVSLQEYSSRILNEILSDGLNEKLKERGLRAKQFIRCYEWLLTLFKDYEEILSKDWLNTDSVFQRECRKEFGSRLRQARIAKNLSTNDLAKKLRLTRNGYGFYELGKRDLPTPTIYRLAKILGVSLDWLFGLK